MMKNFTQPCKTPAEYINSLINEPWARDARHCWRLVIDVQQQLFRRRLPPVLGIAASRAANVELFAHHVERRNWMQIPFPEDGAVVLMRRSAQQAGNYIHAGVYLNIDGGCVLHSDEPHGVVLDNRVELAARGWVADYFIPRA
jgi:hypothetical protein